MDIAKIITQIKTYCPLLQHNVGGAAEHEKALSNGYMAMPAAYVIPSADDAEDNGDLNGLTQDITESVGIVVVLDATADRRGQAGALSVESMKYGLHKALLNWHLDEQRAARGLQYDGGSLLTVTGAKLIWQFNYSHRIRITEEDGFIPASTPITVISGNTLPYGNRIEVTIDQSMP